MRKGQAQIIKKLYDAGIILKKGPDHPDGFILNSGAHSDIYINIRDLIKQPTTFNLVIQDMFDSLFYYVRRGACIVGIPTMGAVLAPVLAYKTGIPLAVIRNNKKDHGVGREIEGTLTNHILVIDDVITSGRSVTDFIKRFVFPRFGDNYTLDILVIVDRQQHPFEDVRSLATLQNIQEWEPSETDDVSAYIGWNKK